MERADELWEQAERSRNGDDFRAVLAYLEEVGADSDAEGCWRYARACKDVALFSNDKKEKTALLLQGLELAKKGEGLDPTNFKLPLWKGIMYGQVTL